MAQLVRDPAAITRYGQLLEPRAAGRMDYVISIKPQIITGNRLAGWCRRQLVRSGCPAAPGQRSPGCLPGLAAGAGWGYV